MILKTVEKPSQINIVLYWLVVCFGQHVFGGSILVNVWQRKNTGTNTYKHLKVFIIYYTKNYHQGCLLKKFQKEVSFWEYIFLLVTKSYLKLCLHISYVFCVLFLLVLHEHKFCLIMGWLLAVTIFWCSNCRNKKWSHFMLWILWLVHLTAV